MHKAAAQEGTIMRSSFPDSRTAYDATAAATPVQLGPVQQHGLPAVRGIRWLWLPAPATDVTER